jgi:hypothetical protein
MLITPLKIVESRVALFFGLFPKQILRVGQTAHLTLQTNFRVQKNMQLVYYFNKHRIFALKMSPCSNPFFKKFERKFYAIRMWSPKKWIVPCFLFD